MISVTVASNTPQIAAAIRRATAAVSAGSRDPDVGAALVQVNARLLGFTRRRFETQSRSGGSSEWPDLAVSTKVRRLSKTKTQRRKLDKARKTTGQKSRAAQLRELAASTKLPILVDTGILRASLTTGAPGAIDELTPFGSRIGTAIRYARYHQDGSNGRPPARPIIVKPDAATINAAVRLVVQGMRRAIEREMRNV